MLCSNSGLFLYNSPIGNQREILLLFPIIKYLWSAYYVPCIVLYIKHVQYTANHIPNTFYSQLEDTDTYDPTLKEQIENTMED